MNEVLILGVSLGFNTSACLYSNTRGILAAVSQERLNGEKNTREFPFDAILECFRIANERHYSELAFCHWRRLTLEEIGKYTLNEEARKVLFDLCEMELFDKLPKTGEEIFRSLVKRFLEEKGIFASGAGAELLEAGRVEHHMAHRYAGYAFYGKREEHLSITSDGFGDGVSTRIVYVKGDAEQVLLENPLAESLGLIYQYVTGAFGFKEHQHEGKLTGLAAYGANIYCLEFEKLYEKSSNGLDMPKLTEEEMKEARKSTIIDFDKLLKLKKATYALVEKLLKEGARKEDIAASLQAFVENKMYEFLTKAMMSLGEGLAEIEMKKIPVYLSGGLFGNVKLNQRIKDLRFVKELLVTPPMGDEGTAVGSAACMMEKAGWCKITKNEEKLMRKVCSGPEMYESFNLSSKANKSLFSEFEEKATVIFEKSIYEGYGGDDKRKLEKVIAQKLAEKKIVCLCRGRMEFGPRALCDRSILYDCTELRTNWWLNEKLSRTEFMPFAPVCKRENADRFFEGTESCMDTARFMTVTFDCKEEFKDKYKAAVHIDGTARPQFVSKKDNKFMHRILTEYEKLTGLQALVNTSFNLHNKPIVLNMNDAVESWLKSGLDVLVIGDTVFQRRHSI